jgi:hypothetical protein
MYSLGCSNMNWNGDWGWGPGLFVWSVFAVVLLAIFVIPWFFFLLNLSNLLERVSDRNRAMPAGHVWLNFIPLFNLGWFIHTVIKVRDSVRDEYGARGWVPEGDFGYNVGITAGCLAIASVFTGWIPLIGWAVNIGCLVCWIIYWFKTADLKNRLGAKDAWRGTAAPPPYSHPAPTAPGQAPYPGPQATYPYAAPAAPAAQAPQTGSSTDQSERVKSCAACGASYDAADRFCRSCGLPLPPG